VSKVDRINACRAVRRSTGHLQVYPVHPSAELVAFRKEHRAWRMVPLLAALALAVFLGAIALAGCAHLGAFGRGIEGAGEVMQKQAHPGVALAGVFVSLAGAVVTAIGKKYEKPLVTAAGVTTVAFGIGAAGAQNDVLPGHDHTPPAVVAPVEPGVGQ
jgi:hypothetical protein